MYSYYKVGSYSCLKGYFGILDAYLVDSWVRCVLEWYGHALTSYERRVGSVYFGLGKVMRHRGI